MADNRHVIRYKKKCVVCGIEFGAWNQNQKFCCPEHKREALLKMGDEYREKRRLREEEKKVEQKKKAALIDISAEARKAGMSYGRYVAMMKL